jgi:putative protease
MVFYQRHHTHEHQNNMTGYSKSHQQQFCGEISQYDQDNRLAVIDVKNKFSIGDALELILPSGNQNFTVEHMFDMHGVEMQEASGSGYRVKIPIPSTEINKGLLARYISYINPTL